MMIMLHGSEPIGRVSSNLASTVFCRKYTIDISLRVDVCTLWMAPKFSGCNAQWNMIGAPSGSSVCVDMMFTCQTGSTLIFPPQHMGVYRQVHPVFKRFRSRIWIHGGSTGY